RRAGWGRLEARGAGSRAPRVRRARRRPRGTAARQYELSSSARRCAEGAPRPARRALPRAPQAHRPSRRTPATGSRDAGAARTVPVIAAPGDGWDSWPRSSVLANGAETMRLAPDGGLELERRLCAAYQYERTCYHATLSGEATWYRIPRQWDVADACG